MDLGDESINNTEKPSTAPSQEQETYGEEGQVSIQIPTTNKGKEPTLEKFHTPGSLENVLSWGDQQIPKSVDELVYVQAIAYDRKI
jgi:hypothetical protein